MHNSFLRNIKVTSNIKTLIFGPFKVFLSLWMRKNSLFLESLEIFPGKGGL